MSSRRHRSPLLIAVLVAGCSGGAPSPVVPASAVAGSGPPAATVPASSATHATPTGTAAPTPASASPALAAPPPAMLSVEGGDPVVGQLGTYTWGDGGSDAPWLQGAPITVGTGEPLVLSFAGTVAVERWEARLVPAGADGPMGGRSAGSGAGEPRLTAPAPGATTLAVEITFAEGQGSAVYAWLLDVR